MSIPPMIPLERHRKNPPPPPEPPPPRIVKESGGAGLIALPVLVLIYFIAEAFR